MLALLRCAVRACLEAFEGRESSQDNVFAEPASDVDSDALVVLAEERLALSAVKAVAALRTFFLGFKMLI